MTAANTPIAATAFFGWRVMWAAFTVAVFGWGVGFYGPPVFLHTLEHTRGWSIGLVSAAVTAHFLLGALCVANMPAIYRRFGVSAVTKASAVCVAIGIAGWANAQAPWQLFIATIFSGLGWAGTGALAINMMISPWFNRRRPAALSTAYNGASVGGIVFSPLWVALIAAVGFPAAAALVGATMVATLWLLSHRYLRLKPEDVGAQPDGDGAGQAQAVIDSVVPAVRPGRYLWTSRAFVTYASGFAIGLFAQVGIIAHLISLLVPALGALGAGLAAGLATACAIVGRMLVGWCLPANADRRVVAAATCLIQALGCVAFILAQGQSVPLLLLGVVLFGIGIGNVTSLSPLIAQVEFAPVDVPRAIALATAISQATFAFAPAVFGFVREWAGAGDASTGANVPAFFIVAAAVQMIAALAYLTGRPTKLLVSS
jgi:MFS family permease